MERKRYPEKYKEFVQFEAYSKNPYLEEITGVGRFFLNNKQDLLKPVYGQDGLPLVAQASETGQMLPVGQKYTGDYTTIDRRQYAKMYVEFIGLLVKKGIGLPAVRMLFFILKRLKIGSDIVQFTISAAKSHTGYKTDKSIYEGLVELIKMGVIARKEGTEEQFYINPQYIFRGKRDKLLDTDGDVELQS
jgi:hypothetical protein